MDLLELDNINFSYENKEIFSSLNLKLQKNTINILIGNNSCGKTTLLKILSGIIFVDGIKFNGTIINKKSIFKLRNNTFYADNNPIFYGKTVYEEIEILSDEPNNRFINKLLKEFQMENISNKSPSLLSNLEKQKLNLIKAIFQKKQLILLDNIFSLLEEKELFSILEMLKKYINKYNLTLIVSSVDTNIVFEFDNILILDNKKIIFNDNYIDEDLFEKIGLNLPFKCELSEKLNLYELLKEDVYNIDEMVEKIC